MINIGTSGFSYDDWKGYFYPTNIAKKDMLAYYSRHFANVEINSTYYNIPSVATFRSLVNKTPDEFKFCVKAHRDMTHSESHSPDTFHRFRESLSPLIDSGKLGCVLGQFPWSFKRTAQNRNRLQNFKDAIGTLPTVLEFRNSEWVQAETFELLRELGFGFCCVDEPALRGLMPRIAIATSSITYVRFHGRNAGNWWKHEESWQRYDYLYSEDELTEWVPKVQSLAGKSDTTFVFFNTHYHAKAVDGARLFAGMLKVPLPEATQSQLKFTG